MRLTYPSASGRRLRGDFSDVAAGFRWESMQATFFTAEKLPPVAFPSTSCKAVFLSGAFPFGRKPRDTGQLATSFPHPSASVRVESGPLGYGQRPLGWAGLAAVHARPSLTNRLAADVPGAHRYSCKSSRGSYHLQTSLTHPSQPPLLSWRTDGSLS
jgi:hypothetical protein